MLHSLPAAKMMLLSNLPLNQFIHIENIDYIEKGVYIYKIQSSPWDRLSVLS